MTTFDWIIKLLKEYGSLFLKGTGYTMAMAVAGTLIGLLIGLLIGIVTGEVKKRLPAALVKKIES